MPKQHLVLTGAVPDVLTNLKEILLTQSEYEVEECPPDELLDRCRTRTPDLVLLANGLDLIRRLITSLKNESLTQQVPVLVALSQFTESAAAQTLEMGADEFLAPPFSPPEVLARVAVLLQLQRHRQMLLTAKEEFPRLFRQNPQPLFYCDRQGTECHLNPALQRLLGYPERREILTVPADALMYSEEDKERFRKILAGPPSGGHVKVNLRSRTGQPLTVLLNDLKLDLEHPGFQVQQVGAVSPLKKALKSLVEAFLPSARDYLALLSMTPLIGGRYEKIKKLGQGSFGEIWLVLDTEATGPERRYVAKIPFFKTANAKFRQEAAICQQLAPHPGVPKLVDIVEDDGKVVLIQEYVEGRTLADMLGEELPPPLVESIILQLIEVVAHAHAHRIIHRDIKPNNIIIQADGTLKLMDYGAAKLLKEKDISATMIGSRPFMAPEQLMGKSERRSDIWAIGVIMYLLYTGELPFYSDVEKLLIDQILEQEPVPPRQLNPELPPALEEIILKCLKKKPEERYPNALALKADLLHHFPDYGKKAR
uniref:Response regulator n=1 Tax=Desulfobacca acetoxidans TaxID=60893 RepID=A0A7C3WIK3_9BACT